MVSIRARSLKGQWLRTVRNPPKYLWASLIVTLGGLLNGLDSGTIGPVTVMPSFTDSFGELSSSLHGLVISSVMLPAAFTSLFAGALSDSLGRTHALGIGAFAFAIGAALEAGAASLGMFIAGRCVVGVGEGLFLSTLIVYVCEISPPSKRGPLVTMVQLLITVGLCIGYFACYGTVNIPSSLSWRLPLALQAGIAFFLAIASWFYLPHSPRWLAYKGRREEASVAWDKLGVSNAEREKDLLQAAGPSAGLAVTNAPRGSAEALKADLLDKVRRDLNALTGVFKKDARKPMFLGIFLMSMQQLSGIDGIIYYAPLLFQQAGINSSKATFLASGISAILIFVFTILAVVLSDRWGRRASTIYGGLVMFTLMSMMGLLYATDNVHGTYGAGRWIVIISIYVFAIGYSMTWAIGMKLFASEIQPVATRAIATSLAQAANCMTNFLVAFITPVLLARSSSGIYFLFGGSLLLTIGVCIMYMPETRGRDLESVREMFGLHKAVDIPVVRAMRSLGSQIGRMVGLSSVSRQHFPLTEGQDVELENL